MVLLPVSPEFLIALYDTGVYSIEKGVGNAADIRKASDAKMANELRFLNACSNVYFSEESDARRLLEQLAQCNPRRRESDSRVVELVESDAKATYVRADSPRGKEDPGAR
jgi:hypothetical protein